MYKTLKKAQKYSIIGSIIGVEVSDEKQITIIKN